MSAVSGQRAKGEIITDTKTHEENASQHRHPRIPLEDHLTIWRRRQGLSNLGLPDFLRSFWRSRLPKASFRPRMAFFFFYAVGPLDKKRLYRYLTHKSYQIKYQIDFVLKRFAGAFLCCCGFFFIKSREGIDPTNLNPIPNPDPNPNASEGYDPRAARFRRAFWKN